MVKLVRFSGTLRSFRRCYYTDNVIKIGTTPDHTSKEYRVKLNSKNDDLF